MNQQTNTAEPSGRTDCSLSGALLFDIAERLKKIRILGPWQPNGDEEFARRSPGCLVRDASVKVWKSWPNKYSDTSYCQEEGWYWEIGFGIVSIGRFANYSEPHAEASEAMAAVDSCLRTKNNVVLV